ncbi:sinapoylglucose--choline O-sinapoyltransferase [Trifolium repens]|nr:sinapoylglucose--choline O-sinapoyltransferase [Trifolium repens]
MTRFNSSHYNGNSNSFTTILFVFVLLVLLQTHLIIATSESNIVKFLPGFQGPLPFLLETGYVEVSETESDENAEVFYYFIESENNPMEDPLLLWLTGGPGCSGFSGIFFEIGPITFINDEYNGSLPNLALKSHSWTKVSNIIFLDLPVGTGFSYPKTDAAVQQSTWKLVHNAHQFLRKWLVDHPKFISHKVYIAGDSYSGIPLPIIVQEISYGNDDGLQPWINLQGYILGNPLTTPNNDDYRIPFSHGMALISDELYQSLEKNCRGEYKHIDSQNVFCLKDFQSYKEAISNVCQPHILDPNCESDFDKIIEVPRRTLLIDKADQSIISSSLKTPPLSCRTHVYFLCPYWANDDNVRKALHIRKGSIGKWKRCNGDLPFKHETLDSFPYHANLSRKGFRSLIYSGDHDMKVPFLATQAWIKSLNYSIVDDWRQWYYNDQVAGYTRTYSNRMTFATVKGGGHTTPEFKPEECSAMFIRWISNKPL